MNDRVGTRTQDRLIKSQVLYQTEPRPDLGKAISLHRNALGQKRFSGCRRLFRIRLLLSEISDDWEFEHLALERLHEADDPDHEHRER